MIQKEGPKKNGRNNQAIKKNPRVEKKKIQIFRLKDLTESLTAHES